MKRLLFVAAATALAIPALSAMVPGGIGRLWSIPRVRVTDLLLPSTKVSPKTQCVEPRA